MKRIIELSPHAGYIPMALLCLLDGLHSKGTLMLTAIADLYLNTAHGIELESQLLWDEIVLYRTVVCKYGG